jgi:hypothetical protein
MSGLPVRASKRYRSVRVCAFDSHCRVAEAETTQTGPGKPFGVKPLAGNWGATAARWLASRTSVTRVTCHSARPLLGARRSVAAMASDVFPITPGKRSP